VRTRIPLVLALAACGVPADDAVDADTDVTGGDQQADSDTDDPFAGWGPPTEVSLRLTEVTPPELVLDLDRAAVAELFGDSAKDVVLLDLDPLPMLTATLDRIKEACGTDWKRDKANPTYDCTLTELGRTFHGKDGTWRSSPEFALIRILTMTPANAEVSGTSLATLADIADFLGLGGGFAQILSDGLALPRTEEFLDTAPVAAAMRDNLLASHPAVRPDGFIPFTLEDALTDLATLGPRLGPAFPHPGITDPTSPTHGVVLGPDFTMHAAVRSNLRVLDGVDLSGGKGYLGVIVDETGPSFDDEVEFDFDDPSRFWIRGLTDTPTVDLRFQVQEHDRYVPSCGGVSRGRDCRTNLPGAPVGAGTVWTLDPWDLEWAIAAAGRIKYGGLRNEVCYLTCFSVDLAIGKDGDPAGFARFGVLLDIGSPPPAQYAWELIDEVAQVRVHDPGTGSVLPEGQADVAFTMTDVPVGITGRQAEDAVRPFLAAQRALISDYLLGDYRDDSDPVDLVYRRLDGGAPALVWVADGDTGRPWTYANPGLFADPELTVKASSLVVPGSTDTTHEKWVVRPGDTTLYAVDDQGTRYRLDVVAPDLTDPKAEISVVVRREAP
jgi:hypothetical protein